jgi:hypothetical protein
MAQPVMTANNNVVVVVVVAVAVVVVAVVGVNNGQPGVAVSWAGRGVGEARSQPVVLDRQRVAPGAQRATDRRPYLGAVATCPGACPSSIFLDKNSRDIGKSQSKRAAFKMETPGITALGQPPPHRAVRPQPLPLHQLPQPILLKGAPPAKQAAASSTRARAGRWRYHKRTQTTGTAQCGSTSQEREDQGEDGGGDEDGAGHAPYPVLLTVCATVCALLPMAPRQTEWRATTSAARPQRRRRRLLSRLGLPSARPERILLTRRARNA